MKKLEKNVLMKDLGNRKIRMKIKKMPNQSFERTEKAPPLNSDVPGGSAPRLVRKMDFVDKN